MTDKGDEGNAPKNITAACAAEPETDIGNARRFLHRYGDSVLHVAHIGWHGYDGLRWREDEDGSVIRPMAHKTAEAILGELPEIRPSEGEDLLIEAGEAAEEAMVTHGRPSKDAGDDRHRQWREWTAAVEAAAKIKDRMDGRRSARARHAKSTAGSGKIDAMLKEAAPYRAATAHSLNPDALAVNTNGGTLRLVQIEDEESDPDDPRYLWRLKVTPHERNDLISKLIQVDLGPGFAPGETPIGGDAFGKLASDAAPTFLQFLRQTQPDVERRRYLQRLAGYMLLGLNSEQCVVFFYGIGANGKSTYTDALSYVLNDYAVTLSIDSFAGDTRKGGSDATPDLVRLMGARACFASEGDEGVKMREGLVKLLTGGDKLPVRRLHQEFVEISVEATVIITGNHKPVIRGDDDGIWRRIHLVDWPVQIPKDKRDRHLPEKLKREAPGILAWMIEGALEFLTLGGLQPPQSVLDLTQEHREESDPIGAFVRGACVVTGDSHDEARPGELYAAYLDFAKKEGVFGYSQAAFAKRFARSSEKGWPDETGIMREFRKSKSNGMTVYRGVSIRPDYLGGGESQTYGGAQRGAPPMGDEPPGYGG